VKTLPDLHQELPALEQILERGSPRTHEYESLTGKIRRRERRQALEQIQKVYSPCNVEEALMVYNAFKEYAVGTSGILVEIDIESVPDEVARWNNVNTNPFLKYVTFFARIGATMGTLSYDKASGGYRFNSTCVSKKQIDQVWKFHQIVKAAAPMATSSSLMNSL
jgi:hypothetical protein